MLHERSCKEDKKTTTEREKYLQTTYPPKEWYVGYIKNCQTQQLKNNNNTDRKWAEDINGCFTEAEIQLANKDMKRCPTSLPIMEVQIKITIKYHYTSIRMAKIKLGTTPLTRMCRKGALVHFKWEL